MKNIHFLFLAITALALASLGCKVSLNLPMQEISAGELQTESIQIMAPDSEVVDVDLVFGAGELTIAPGSDSYLISGQATYNVENFKPVIKFEENRVKLETGNIEIGGIPDLKNIDDFKNEWDLLLGNTPMNLSISSGAYQGDLEFGSLLIKNLEITDGAADVTLRFSTPNLVAMDSFRYTTGASNVKLFGLGNANFASMIFRSGAGEYLLDFTGGILRDTVITIESGVSQVTVDIPVGVNAKVIFKGGLVTINPTGNWEKSGDQYILQGTGPSLTINVDMGAGTLNLKSSD